MINGVDAWAITKLDVLDQLETLKICVAYECDGRTYDTMPGSVRQLRRCTPVYEELPGWKEPTGDVTDFGSLPANAKAYLERICALTGVRIGMLSVGPKRSSTLRIAI
jgi:adenylosuccinate synthase